MPDEPAERGPVPEAAGDDEPVEKNPAPETAWSERDDHEPRTVNVGEAERWASVIGGMALALYGLGRRSLKGVALALTGAGLVHRGVTGHCQLYGALGFGTAEARSPVASVPHHQGVRVERAVTIDRSPEELYRFWRSFENLPRFLNNLQSVTTTGEGRSHWVARAPLGWTVEWDAEIVNERENELIAWRSLEGADIHNAGSVQFHELPGGRGTEVKVVLEYRPPAGRLGAAVARLFAEDPDRQIREDLHQLKQVMEQTGDS